MIQEISLETTIKRRQRREKRKSKQQKIERDRLRAKEWHLQRVADKEAQRNSRGVATAIACRENNRDVATTIACRDVATEIACKAQRNSRYVATVIACRENSRDVATTIACRDVATAIACEILEPVDEFGTQRATIVSARRRIPARPHDRGATWITYTPFTEVEENSIIDDCTDIAEENSIEDCTDIDNCTDIVIRRLVARKRELAIETCHIIDAIRTLNKQKEYLKDEAD